MPASLSDIRAAKTAFADWLFHKRSIRTLGIGVGLKATPHRVSDDTCIQLFVDVKRPRSDVARRNLIPESVDGFPTDVRSTPIPRFMAANTRPSRAEVELAIRNRRTRSRTRPLVAGVSCSNQFVPAGTLGYFCQKEEGEGIYLLSSGHVFKGKSSYKSSSTILQASPSDGGYLRDAVGTLTHASSLDPTDDVQNIADVAIAKLGDGIKYKLEVHDVGPLTGTTKAYPGMLVEKVGRTTGLTQGIVTAIDYETTIPWGWRSVQTSYRFKNQIRIEPTEGAGPFAQFGDSGSMVFSKQEHAATGLYFAGAPDGSYGLATPIASVERILGVKLLV